MVVCSVKTGKVSGQHKTKHPASRSGGPNMGQGQYRKKKKSAKKDGQPFKQGNHSSKGGGKSDTNP